MAILPGIEIGTVEYPGCINIDTEQAKLARGCAVIRFKAGVEGDAETQWMRWAAENKLGVVVVEWKPDGGDVVVLYTKTMSDAEIEEHTVFGQLFTQVYWPERQKKLNEVAEKQAAAQKEREEKAKQEAEAKQKELERLAELGRKYEKQQKNAKKQELPPPEELIRMLYARAAQDGLSPGQTAQLLQQAFSTLTENNNGD